MARFVCYCVFLLSALTSSAQLIVNIENSRIQSDTTGWRGDINTSFAFTHNRQEVLNINAGAHLQYKTKKDLYLLLANYNLLKGNGKELTDNMFYHLRYNRKLGDVVRWEVFSQWQQNNLNNIALRTLVGTGPRFKLHDNKKFKLYAAALVMYEHEKDIQPTVIYKDIRSDTYITFTLKPNAVTDITSTTFYQPVYRDISDFRVLNQISFVVKATKHLSISVNWDYSYDSRPAFGTPNINYTVNNGFHYTF